MTTITTEEFSLDDVPPPHPQPEAEELEDDVMEDDDESFESTILKRMSLIVKYKEMKKNKDSVVSHNVKYFIRSK